MDSNERVFNLEETVAGMGNKLNQILNTMSKLTQNISATPPTPPPVIQDTPPHSGHESKKTCRPKPATPPEFDGGRKKGLTFLHSCQTYIRLCPEEFCDDQTKIVWAMSYMKSGRAAKWTSRIFRWEDFRDEFKKEFTPAHVDSLAINRL
jgi:hypothetical protein